MGHSEKAPSRSSSPAIHWRWARGIMMGVLALVTLTIAFYTEENWRGIRAWNKCRQQLEATGAVYDWASRIPPPVPDDENFFKAPKMTEWFVGRSQTDLSRRLQSANGDLTGSVGLATNRIATIEAARNYLAWSDQFVPDFDLIRNALKRPYARIECDYTRPMTVLAPNFQTMRSVAQVLAQRAHCFLLLGNPDAALHELTLVHDYCRMLEGAPSGKPITLLAAMINVAVAGLYAHAVADGLTMHAWGDAQLSELERQLFDVRIASCLAETFHDEPMFSLRTLETSTRAELIRLCPDQTGPIGGARKTPRTMLKYAPRGWLYQNIAVHARLVHQYAEGFDAVKVTVSPRKIDDAGYAAQASINCQTPYEFLNYWFMPIYVKAVQRFAVNQTLVNQAAVACALERYRLAHNEYPETLDALLPSFIARLPHDVIEGGPLKYRSNGGGTFVLYSIGWDGKDDGGTPGPQTAGQTPIGLGMGKSVEEGDWVWSNPINL